jgi:Icc-related predicted phosphoesterase
MKLLFVADLHYALRQFDWVVARAAQYDLVAIGGDLLDLASPLDIDLQIVVVEKYLDRIAARTRLLVTSGNHDGDARSAADESVAVWLQQSREKGVLVDGDSAVIAGTFITACPWWDGPVSRAQVQAQIERDAAQNPARWFWIHHAPPDGSPVSWTGRHFAGDAWLRGWIERFQPDAVLSGHIHHAPFYAEGSWIDRLGRTWVFNPGRQPGPSPTFIEIDLAGRTAAWISAEETAVRDLYPGLSGIGDCDPA